MRKSPRMLHILGLVLAAAFSASSALAEVDFTTVTVEGSGETREDSIFDALASAVRQVHGAEITTRRVVAQNQTQMVVSGPNGEESKISLSSGYKGEVSASSSGLVSGYSVLSSSVERGLHISKVKVTLPRYRAPGIRSSATRRELAVYPFTANSTLLLLQQRLNSVQLADDFTQAVVQEFTRSRRFAVLERQRVRAVMAERNLIAQDDVPVIEKAKLGGILGADYVVYGDIKSLDIDIATQRLAVSGETYSRFVGSINVDIRIVSPVTNQIHWADTVKLDGADIFHSSDSITFEEARLRIIEHAARTLVSQATEAIYPILIVQKSSAGELVLNQGGTALALGDQLTVYRLENELKDPYSGESLGRAEVYIGNIEITRVASKMSYARPIEEYELGPDLTNYVVRIAREHEPTRMLEAQLEEIRGSRRGVRLPFDKN
ncbi:MAG: CsgG/HfaB family protein [Wenzhouxiangellaceae bacterium]|nr:CsgG/HfaB family protein [Wenzhouxiangellaceae bacterium]